MQDTSKIKEGIISVIRTKGPNFPAPIASEIQTSILFTSAFLSELLSDKQVKITNMRVGSSPIYYVPGQEIQLEHFASKYLKSKEKEAFTILKEKRILKDADQLPAIRVALREIKDFAIPEEKNKELYWRYFLCSNEEFRTFGEIKEIDIQNEKNIDEKPPQKEIHKEKVIKKKEIKKVQKVTKTTKKNDENFFNKIKEYLAKKQIEILDIINFSKGEAILKIKKNDSEEILFAFNKKKISEKDILKAFKKSSEYRLSYSILSTGDSPKKISEMVSAIKNLSNIDNIGD
jgi:hypothetical protein